MKKAKERDLDEMPAEIDFDYSKAEWGKFAGKVVRTKSIAYIEPEVAAVFPDSASVNRALKQVIALSKLTLRPKTIAKPARTGKLSSRPVKE